MQGRALDTAPLRINWRNPRGCWINAEAAASLSTKVFQQDPAARESTVVTKSKAGEAKPKAIRKVSQPRASKARLAAPEATDAVLPAEAVDAPDAATPSESPELNKKDLIAQVVQRSGVKKKFAKPVIEALLVVLGDAIAEGRELNLQPLGKVKVTNTKSVANGKVMNTRIRQSDAARGAVESTGEDSGKETLADPAE
ncbi:hypothetical protein F3W81_06900 [Pseudooceanicola spongiae]|uniref:DNA-binding protein n=1 Tax=Pseudooceanicola spongiae TaxID=2613965 RepID=A0A7L9WUD6_9RHOB|nr:hypothetical protein F3W81_06900 [Pseudooceanicola spongiae]